MVDYKSLNEQLNNTYVDYNEEGHYIELSLNRPKLMNAINIELLQEIVKILLIAEKDKKIRCVVLRGTKNFTLKPSFSTGADLSPAGASVLIMSPAEKDHFNLERLRLYDQIEAFIKPLIAAVDGFALGGGLELALTCDLVLASSRSTFGFPEVKHGLFPTNGGTQRMIRHIGLARTKKMIFTGDFYPAKTMAEWGFVLEVFEDNEFEEKVRQFAIKMGNSPTVALIYAKRSLNYGTQVPLSIGLQFESQGFGINSTSKDMLEGVESFVEKRKPVFHGK